MRLALAVLLVACKGDVSGTDAGRVERFGGRGWSNDIERFRDGDVVCYALRRYDSSAMACVVLPQQEQRQEPEGGDEQ